MTTIDESKLITATDLMDMPDDGCRAELVRGSLVRDQAPGFEHSTIVANLCYHLRAWSTRTKTGRVGGEGGFKLQTDPDTVRAPDVAFVSNDRLPAGRTTGYLEGAPDLAVEVVSPNDQWVTLVDKVGEYFDACVEQVWIVVPTNRTVMIHRSLQDVTVVNERDTIVGDGILAGLELPVADIFE
ncbi:MAG: Uma2 family endonuclease [Gemmatimonadetes bacterium]|jgi:Uma2 family endonuclease|nr:Uma2 family endonuclease [Gemmatimonadota bacterium]MBT7428931.1 Uma2 family endonuclease [Ilumatobacter sp.]MBT5057654.1 Uma2 family endonuclease [Gemmatimonadota bacterium]MBT5146162.1 Uma2 family endonuclease [Gemmatimonadota bacterium]MBT5590805.1 Uma2 family endonuclease [Gemmatimonadota bacterium]